MGLLTATLALTVSLGNIPDVGERKLEKIENGNTTVYTIFNEEVEVDKLSIAGQCTNTYINTRSDEWVCETPNRTYYLKLLASDKVR